MGNTISNKFSFESKQEVSNWAVNAMMWRRVGNPWSHSHICTPDHTDTGTQPHSYPFAI